MITLPEILATVDHTVLSPATTKADIVALCDDARQYRTASVCIPPSFVKVAAEYLHGDIAVCTVIGFPTGYVATAVKCEEARLAVADGADEIDMVINIGWVKDGRFDDVLAEINAVKAACNGKLLKVIIETCLLTDEEKITLCDIVSRSDADFIKTSTGFSTGGATLHDIDLFAKHVHSGTKIKAAGGIRSLNDARAFLEHGAHRLGTSSVVRLVKNGGGDGSSY